MKKALITCLAVAAAVFACTKAPEQSLIDMPSFGPDPVPSPSDGNGYVTLSIPAGEALAWKAGDLITLEGSAGVESYSLIPGSSAVKGIFRGKALGGESFNILVPGPQLSFQEVDGTDWSQQTQAANDDASHIRQLYALTNVGDLSDVTLSKEWATANGAQFFKSNSMQLEITVPRAMNVLSSVEVASSAAQFGSYALALPNLDMKTLKHKVKVYIQLPWKAAAPAEGDVLTFVLKGGDLTATREVPVTAEAAVPSPKMVLDDSDWTGEGIVYTLVGSGTAEDPYLLETAEDMLVIKEKLVKEAESPVYFKLENNIDMDGVEWTPLVTQNELYPIDFDGAGFTISNLKVDGDFKFPSFVGVLDGSVHDVVFDKPLISSPNLSETGVVTGWAGRAAGDITASILRVTVKDAIITMPGSAPVGMLCGQGMKVTIRDCHANGTIGSGVSCVGGLVGNLALADNGSVIENCSFTGSINLPNAGDYNGGLVGAIRKGAQHIAIRGCQVEADITSGTTKGNIGGILGANWNGNSDVVVEQCSYKGTIQTGSGNGGTALGGICGYTQAITIRNCSSEGTITQCNYSIGGIAGCVYENCTIENCISFMTILSRHGSGGIAGRGDNNNNASNASSGYNNVFRKCIAWNPSIKSRLDPGIPASNHSSGAVIGRTASKNTHEGCVRRPDMEFDCYADAQYDVLFDQPDNDASGALYLPKSLGQHYWPYHGKAAAADKTASEVATDLGWDTEIWDLSGTNPVLK